jgi:hypothetical protein
MPVIWRDAVHADLPRLEELWAAQQARFEERAPTVHATLPDLFYPVEETQHAFYPFRRRCCECGWLKKTGS